MSLHEFYGGFAMVLMDGVRVAGLMVVLLMQVFSGLCTRFMMVLSFKGFACGFSQPPLHGHPAIM